MIKCANHGSTHMIAPEEIYKNTPRESKQTSKKRKSLTTHWSGVEVTYYATTTINIFIKILQTKQSLRLFTAVTNYRVFINWSQIRQKGWDTRSRSREIEPSKKLLQKKRPGNVWTCEKNPQHWCLQEKSKKSSDRFKWIKTFLKSTFCILRGKKWPFLKFKSLP